MSDSGGRVGGGGVYRQKKQKNKNRVSEDFCDASGAASVGEKKKVAFDWTLALDLIPFNTCLRPFELNSAIMLHYGPLMGT